MAGVIIHYVSFETILDINGTQTLNYISCSMIWRLILVQQEEECKFGVS